MLKEKDFNYHLPLEMTNTSVSFDTPFWDAVGNYEHPDYESANRVFRQVTKNACQFADPGFSFNFGKDVYKYRNACQPAFATVLTPEGIRQFRDIEIGSTIWSGSRWTKVVNKWSTGIKKYSSTLVLVVHL